METHVTRQPVLGEFRQHVLAPLIGNSLFNEVEQLRANHFVYESEDFAHLTRWGANALTEIVLRQAEVAPHRRDLATRATLRQLGFTSFRGHCARLPQSVPTWVPGTCLPDQPDHRAGTFGRQAAARFQTANALTFADLLSQPAR